MLGDQPKLQDQPKRLAPEARLERLERKPIRTIAADVSAYLHAWSG